ncbi:MAG: AAA family ATPase [Steroidobacteraceae bacterium]
MHAPLQDNPRPFALGPRLAELLQPAAFPHPVTQLQVRETPISWVLLTGVYAYKIKKPVQFDFIDASTLNRRHFLCEEELRLNRRIAPDLYLDVVPIFEQHGHLRMGTAITAGTAGTAGTALEYAVRMREFDTAGELDHQLDQGRVTCDDMAALGRRIAEQHRTAAVAGAGDEFGRPELIRAQLQENFGPLRGCLTDAQDLRLLERLERWSAESMDTLANLLARRRQSARVRECHGDLHAGNIVRWHGHFLPFDCLEFDPRLRWIDVISDVAFLFMDLTTHARIDLSCVFLSAYLEDNGDYEGLRLLPLYAVYRALVRAKVDALGIATASPDSAQARWARLRARLNTAAQLISARTPALLLMHGVTASGKSWISDRLIAALGAVRMRSDLERRRPDGTARTAQDSLDVGDGAYTAVARQRTYLRLLDCADSTLAGGCNAIVDATFLDRADRRLFEALAQRRRCPILIVSCIAARPTLEARLTLRSRRADDPSEATLAVLDMQLKTAEPLSHEEQARTVVIDTGSADTINAGIRNVQARVQGVTGENIASVST